MSNIMGEIDTMSDTDAIEVLVKHIESLERRSTRQAAAIGLLTQSIDILRGIDRSIEKGLDAVVSSDQRPAAIRRRHLRRSRPPSSP